MSDKNKIVLKGIFQTFETQNKNPSRPYNWKDDMYMKNMIRKQIRMGKIKIIFKI